MSEKNARKSRPQKAVSMDQRIAELRVRNPVDLNHGEALMLQGLAAASLREQRLTDEQIAFEE